MDGYDCFKPRLINVNMIEERVWAQVEEILHDYKDSTYDLLLSNFENEKGNREAQITKARKEIQRCQNERQIVLRPVRKGNITQADADTDYTFLWPLLILSFVPNHFSSKMYGRILSPV